MHRRKQIAMTDAEVAAFLDEQRTLTCATIGPSGWPHLAPLWFVVRDGQIWAWTYGKSQKVRNLERDPRATLQVEAGVDYSELRGVTFECDVVIHRDLDTVTGIGVELAHRYTGGAGLAPGAEEMMRRQAAKRVGLQFVERKRTSWDHRKLGGGY
ncbi:MULTISPECIES: pyridoxamine 5'-phosphate oxidase family protein [Thermocrispum]|jgi:PPOX class probable F420-dependent enzyme|uniref:Pyridoxamine 5'-phosphate oxidase n=1 Tax=Thermocrispum agreste TaxID=37925 RepID=A0A2W4IS53_9PSEU|nr:MULTISPECIES: pyridoxamine 5'-phosphate oxidase family protein [Thermocrispum]PZM88475.1 MAG: pyridoxamine 5'-phosphate oxidase [Thermocrispum agreste]